MTKTSKKPRSNSYTGGVILVIFGVLLLLDQMNALDFGDVMSRFWPLILIAIGVKIILFPKNKAADVHGRVEDAQFHDISSGESERVAEDTFNETKVFGDCRHRLTHPAFSGGRCSVTFGDIDINAAEMGVAPGQQTLYLNGVFGDVRLTLPSNVPVLVRANSAAGDINILGRKSEGLFIQKTYKSDDFDDAEDRLVIVASILFGDIKVWRENEPL